MERKFSHLFSPMVVRGKLFKNRIVAAPIGTWEFSPDNYVFDYAIDSFAERAIGGAAQVTMGHTEINYHEEDEDGFGLYFDLRGRNGVAALTEFAKAIQCHGAHASIELNYGGRYRGGNPNGIYYGPSAYVEKDGSQIREMDEEKIIKTIKQYAACAARMKQCGFDMVMIHGAHGWLPEQFFSSKTNHRTDRFGGSFENRIRFLMMLLEEIRKETGDDFLIEYRMGGINPAVHPDEFDEYLQFVRAIEDKIDILHLSTSGLDEMERTIPSYYYPRALNLPYAKALKEAGVKVPITIVGAISDPETADRVIAEGIADFVAIGRGLIADPYFPDKAKHGNEEDIIPCIGCMNCIADLHLRHTVTCSVNPRSYREHRIPLLKKASVSKKVVIIGAGPAGMQAAVTAFDRGHDVTLIESSDRLGGLLQALSKDPTKYLIRNLMNYFIRQVEKRDIKVMLNTILAFTISSTSSPNLSSMSWQYTITSASSSLTCSMS